LQYAPNDSVLRLLEFKQVVYTNVRHSIPSSYTDGLTFSDNALKANTFGIDTAPFINVYSRGPSVSQHPLIKRTEINMQLVCFARRTAIKAASC
jgi:hypothetical protein